MILHCTLPYRPDIPNPALGYLKGFLQAQKIPVQNVYWNIILEKNVRLFNKGFEKISGGAGLLPLSGITLFSARHLLQEVTTSTPLSLIFSSVFTKREIANIIHSFKSTIDQFIRMNNLDKALLSGFTLKSNQWPMALYIMNRLKDMNPATKVVIGGITNEEQAQSFMNVFTKADFAVWGEGEYPLVHLVTALAEGTHLDAVPHLVYRHGKKCVATKAQIECPSLDEYPFADHTDYFTLMEGVSPPPSAIIPIWGSRSCPWNKCKFCSLNENYEYRTRSPENIVKEIEYQSKKHGCDSFIFVDTELPGNKKRFKTLLKLLKENSAKRGKLYSFHAEMSPLFIDPHTAQYMEHAFSSIQIGFEALTDSLLEKMEKRHKFAHNIQALKLGAQYNLNLSNLNVIRGIPSETEDDIKESCINVMFLRFFLGKYPLSPNYLTLEKGSPFYDEIPESEKEKWKANLLWAEIAPTGLIDNVDPFELYGFCETSPFHYREWDIFARVLASYRSQNRSYEWIEYEDKSILEEKGSIIYRYTLTRDETDILIFCDTIKHFKEIKEKFFHIPEDDLITMMNSLKEAGMIYYDKDMSTIIAVVEAYKKKRN
jgi:radical SAM superfamily enzyme YgiQ (UPF0313 family)